jgi:hypothetical protein
MPQPAARRRRHGQLHDAPFAAEVDAGCGVDAGAVDATTMTPTPTPTDRRCDHTEAADVAQATTRTRPRVAGRF